MPEIIIEGKDESSVSVYERRGLLTLGADGGDGGWQRCSWSSAAEASSPDRVMSRGGARPRQESGRALPTAREVQQALRGVPRETLERLAKQYVLVK